MASTITVKTSKAGTYWCQSLTQWEAGGLGTDTPSPPHLVIGPLWVIQTMKLEFRDKASSEYRYDSQRSTCQGWCVCVWVVQRLIGIFRPPSHPASISPAQSTTAGQIAASLGGEGTTRPGIRRITRLPDNIMGVREVRGAKMCGRLWFKKEVEGAQEGIWAYLHFSNATMHCCM